MYLNYFLDLPFIVADLDISFIFHNFNFSHVVMKWLEDATSDGLRIGVMRVLNSSIQVSMNT